MAKEIEPPEIGRLRDKRILWRVTMWGASAAIALAAVAFTSQTEIGAERLLLAFAPEAAPSRTVAQADVLPRDTAKDNETKRLEEQVRALSADRDRLAARIAGLEHNLEDVTGSIKRQLAAVPTAAPAEPPAPGPSAAAPPPVAAPPISIAAPVQPAVPILSPLAMPAINDSTPPWPQPARAESNPEPKDRSESVSEAGGHVESNSRAQIEEKPLAPVTTHSVPMPPTRVAIAGPAGEPATDTVNKPELGIDLGGARTLEILNERWAAVKANFGPLLGGLHPRFTRDHRPGSIPYRLLVGPLPNGAAAAQLCANFAAARVNCRPVKFAGSELTQRRALTADKPAVRHNPPSVVTTPR